MFCMSCACVCVFVFMTLCVRVRQVCELVGAGDFSFKAYAAEENLSMEDLKVRSYTWSKTDSPVTACSFCTVTRTANCAVGNAEADLLFGRGGLCDVS